MSTVGFGDISAGTYFGRTFMMIFISIGLVCDNYVTSTYSTSRLKGRVSQFSACASDDLNTVKIIVFRPIRSAFTTLAGYGGKLL